MVEIVLPKDILQQILLNLPLTNLGEYCKTQKYINRICKSDEFWRLRFQKDFMEVLKLLPLTQQDSAKQTYLDALNALNYTQALASLDFSNLKIYARLIGLKIRETQSKSDLLEQIREGIHINSLTTYDKDLKFLFSPERLAEFIKKQRYWRLHGRERVSLLEQNRRRLQTKKSFDVY